MVMCGLPHKAALTVRDVRGIIRMESSGPVAQSAEQRPFKAWVVRSNRTGLTTPPQITDLTAKTQRLGVNHKSQIPNSKSGISQH